jgi:hypothetical protein
MNGQGSPILVCAAGLPGRCRSAQTPPIVFFLSLLLLCAPIDLPCTLGQPPGTQGELQAEPLDIRLRIDWGAVQAMHWEGHVELSHGRLGDLRSLGIGADVPGNKWFFNHAKRIVFKSRTAATYDGFDLSVVAPGTATLTVRVATREFPDQVKEFRYQVSDLVRDQKTEPLFAELVDEETRPEGSLVVRRTPGDLLRIQFPAGPMIFATGEQVGWRVLASRSGLPEGETYRCLVQVIRARSREVVHEYETTVRTTALGLIKDVDVQPLTVPEEEGVYSLAVSLYRKGGLTGPFLRRGPEITSERQFVSLATSPPEPDQATWSEQTRLEPSKFEDGRWLQLPAVPGIPNLTGEKPVHNGLLALENMEGRPFTKLAEGGWLAYPLRISNPGQPHIIEIAYPVTAPQTLSLGLIEPDRGKRTARAVVETGIDVTKVATDGGMAVRSHRWVIWPTTKTPWLLLANRRTDSHAAFGTIRVLAGPAHLPSGKRANVTERRLAAFFDIPRFPEAFNATEELEPGADRFAFDDWETYYQGSRRMIEHLRYAGYNTLVVNVCRDGSTLYPSSLLEPTPQWDTGPFFSSGQDPHHKDILELLFRLCDREGIRLVASFEFSGAIPGLELAQRQGKNVRLVGDKIGGQRYNILNPTVQTEIRRVLGEVSDRYSWHESFDGIALQLSPNSPLPLPGFAAPLDDQTLAQFQQETQIQVPRAKELSTRGRFLHADPRRHETWLQWRADEVSKFIKTISDDLHLVRGDAVLMLLGNDLLESPLVRYSGENRVDSAMLLLGLDARRLSRHENVTFLKPQTIHPEIRLSGNAPDFESAVSKIYDSYFSGDEFRRSAQSPVGVSFVHPPQKAKVPQFDEANPLKLPQSKTEFSTYVTPSGDENRRRFIQALAFSDMRVIVDGGGMIPVGQEESVLPFFGAFRDLPDKPFRAVEPETLDRTQPIVVRQLIDGDDTFFYLVNVSPWATRVSLEMQNCDSKNITVLGQRQLPRPRSKGSLTNWVLDLEPYDFVAVKHVGSTLKINQWRVTLPETVIQDLTQRLRDLSIRADTQRRERALLQNPGFEQQAGGGPIPGWNSREGDRLKVSLASPGHTGRFGLRMSRAAKTDDLWVDSNAFSPPSTGSLYVSVWLRVEDENKQPPLRIVIFGDQEYYRMLPIGAGEDVKILATWRQFLFPFQDIPVDRLTELHVGFDLMGPGEVFVDDVQVFDLYLNPDHRKLLKVNSNQLGATLGGPRYDVGDCHLFLSGYWPKYLARHMRDDGPNDRVALRIEEPEVTPTPPKEGSKNPLRRVRDAFNFGRDDK